MKSSLELFMAGNWAVVIVYVLATIANVSGVLFSNERIERISYRLAGFGLALHTGVIALWWVEVGHGPYMAPNEVLSSDAWVIMVCYFAFLKLYPRIKPVSILAFPASYGEAFRLTIRSGRAARTLIAGSPSATHKSSQIVTATRSPSTSKIGDRVPDLKYRRSSKTP